MGINLLPPPVQKKIFGAYYIRLAALFFTAFAAAVIIGTLLFAPSFFISRADAEAAAQYLAALKTGGAPASSAETLAAFTEEISLLQTFARPPLAARVLSAVTTSLPSGVYLSSIDITPSDTGGKVSLSGIAGTRQDLLDYTAALQKNPLLSGVSVPVSALAGSRNLPFTLAFSVNPQSP